MVDSQAESIVTIRNLSKRFGGYTAMSGVDLDIRRGEVLTFLGPSGCGKSTLLRMIAGFESPSSGELLLHGEDMIRIPPERRPINMVFQRYALFPHLDVFDNIAFGLRLKKMPEKEVRSKVQDMMKLVQLENMASRWIGEISGGQSQRVALARALVNQPEVLLLDEPLAALDLKIRHHMLTELKRIQETTGITFVYVTHDQDEAMLLSKRVVLMDHGLIKQVGTPDELYFRPRSLFAARFLGDTNIISSRIESRAGRSAVVAFPGGTAFSNDVDDRLQAGDKAVVSIRPEAIRLSPAGDRAGGSQPRNQCAGALISVTPIGGRLVYAIRTEEGMQVKAQMTRSNVTQPFHVGDAVTLSWDPDVMAILPAES